MAELFHAAHVFFDHLTSIAWVPLAAAIGTHVLKIVVRTRAWRNILAAAYPHTRVRWRSVFGSYVAGAGVNAIVPARGGDVLRLYLVKRRIEGSTYPTLAATLAVDTLLDFVLSTALIVWALHAGVLPGLDILPRLRSIDWSWAPRHRYLALAAAGVLLLLALVAAAWMRRRVRELGRQLRAGGAILRRPGLYLRRVVSWQLLDWALRLVTIFLLLRAFGLPATAHNALLVQVTQSLSTVVPLTPAGIGTEQGLILYVLARRAPAAALLSFSVGMKLTLMAVNLVLGFTAIGIMLRTLRWERALAHDERSARQ